MRTEIKEAWIEALRSGEYTQGKRRLRARTGGADGDTFCCLGVLCEVALKAGVQLDVESYPSLGWDAVFEYDGCASVPPDRVADWAGLVHLDPTVGLDDTPLTVLNDLEEASFTEIADLIEEWL